MKLPKTAKGSEGKGINISKSRLPVIPHKTMLISQSANYSATAGSSPSKAG